MSTQKRKDPPKKKRGCGYKLPETFPSGEILKDVAKQSWCIQQAIGVGGFGKIYSATKLNEKAPNYAVKIEPQENGPLFCERNIYSRIAKQEQLEEYKNLKKLKSFGMPEMFGFGSHEFKGTNYRFLVMQRYGKDLWSIFNENNKRFPIWTTYQIGIQLLSVLEYIHEKLYVHGDIKGNNLLLGFTKATENQVYLVDFGLACKYSQQDKPDPKKAHNGTIEYTSLDAHRGVITRRGDIEILGYNLLHWLTSSLPWENMTNPTAVQAEKEKYMSDIPSLMKECYKNQAPLKSLVRYFELCNKLEYNEAPNYDKIKLLLTNEIKSTGHKPDEKLEFKSTNVPSKSTPTKSLKENKVLYLKRKKTEDNVEAEKPKSPAKNNKQSWKTLPTIVNGASLPTTNNETFSKRIAKKTKLDKA